MLKGREKERGEDSKELAQHLHSFSSTFIKSSLTAPSPSDEQQRQELRQAVRFLSLSGSEQKASDCLLRTRIKSLVGL